MWGSILERANLASVARDILARRAASNLYPIPYFRSPIMIECLLKGSSSRSHKRSSHSSQHTGDEPGSDDRFLVTPKFGSETFTMLHIYRCGAGEVVRVSLAPLRAKFIGVDRVAERVYQIFTVDYLRRVRGQKFFNYDDSGDASSATVGVRWDGVGVGHHDSAIGSSR